MRPLLHISTRLFVFLLLLPYALLRFLGRATPDRAGARPYRRTCPNVHCDMGVLPSQGIAYSNPRLPCPTNPQKSHALRIDELIAG